MASCWVITGLVMLALALVASAVSFAAPYWIQYSVGTLFASGTKDQGLLAICTRDSNCQWYFADNMELEKQMPDWFKATQALFALGVVTLLVSFLLACCNLCSGCCKESFYLSNVVSGLLIFAFLELGIAVALYGGKMNHEKNVNLTGNNRFSWGFYLGIAGALLTLLSAFTYICEGCQARTRGYTRGEVV